MSKPKSKLEREAKAAAARMGMLIYPAWDGAWCALYRKCGRAFEDHLGEFRGGLSHVAAALRECEQDTRWVLRILEVVNYTMRPATGPLANKRYDRYRHRD